MQNCLIYLRSVIFYLISIVLTIILFIPATFAITTRHKEFLLYISKLWAKLVIDLLDKICDLRIKAIGLENIANQPVIIASKHQSVLETLYLYTCLDEGKYVLKDSLKFIPILGLCFKQLDMIFIDRKSPVKSIKLIMSKAVDLLNKGKSIIIFPEGTRVAHGAAGRYSPGIASLYGNCNFNIIPVALNTGKYWRRNSIAKYPGTCIIKFLSPIKKGLSKDQFMKELEHIIESNSY